MRFPQEIVVERFIPTVRALLTRDLADRGLTQAQIAMRLGISQSAVSKHLVGRFAPDARLAADARVQDAVARVAEGLAKESMGAVEALAVLLQVVRELENRGPICAIHEEEVPALRGLGCDLCVRPESSRLLAESAALADVRAAVRVLEAHADVAGFIPHVGSNVCAALPDATDAGGVAAVPGSLFVLNGRVRAPASPAFGVSGHVAQVVLAVRRGGAAHAAAMNLASDARLLDAARAQGLVVAEVPPAMERDPSVLADVPADADVLTHAGDFGVEPQTYLLGLTALSVAERAVALAEAARTGT